MQTQKSPNDPHIRIQGTNQFLTSKYSWISIFIEIGDHWQFGDFVGSHFGNGGMVKMTPWMQFSSLPINSSLQNNPRYAFLLKLENIEILPILSAAILKIKMTLNAIFIITNQFLTLK
jgi:hypothetical protein